MQDSKDQTPKVTGIGGVFFYSDNLKETREWYAKNLGLNINDWGFANYEFRNVDKPEDVGSITWNLFKKDAQHFAPSKKEFMINYRVQNLEALVKNLKASGVTIVDDIEAADYGKFIHIMDNEGNKIELWEPVDETRAIK